MNDFFDSLLKQRITEVLATEPLATPLTLDQVDEEIRSCIWPFDGKWDELDIATYINNPLFLFAPYFAVIKASPQSYIVAAPSPLQVQYAIALTSHMLGIPCDQSMLDKAWIRPADAITLAQASKNFRDSE